MYVKMLGQAIAAARGEAPAPDKSDCLVDITVDAFLPEEYIPDAAGRIEAYKRIAAIETTSDAEDVLDELIDRYGSPPKSVQGLVDVSLVRVTAARVGIAEIVQRGDQLILYSDIVGPKQLGEVMESSRIGCCTMHWADPISACACRRAKAAGTAAGCGDPVAGRTESATDKAIKNKHLFAAVKSSKTGALLLG